jgi:hypothetical protein
VAVQWTTALEQSADEPNLNEVRGKLEKEAAGLWGKQKSMIADFNAMCGIERRESPRTTPSSV